MQTLHQSELLQSKMWWWWYSWLILQTSGDFYISMTPTPGRKHPDWARWENTERNHSTFVARHRECRRLCFIHFPHLPLTQNRVAVRQWLSPAPTERTPAARLPWDGAAARWSSPRARKGSGGTREVRNWRTLLCSSWHHSPTAPYRRVPIWGPDDRRQWLSTWSEQCEDRGRGQKCGGPNLCVMIAA